MSTNKRRRRPLKTNKSDLVHEELFDDKPAKVGCNCKQNGRNHGGGWIQCTEADCAVWHCIDDITDNYVLLDDEIDNLQDSNNTFKCILHGFYRMKIGNKSLYQSEDSEANDKNEETYKPPSNVNTNSNSIRKKRKRINNNSDNSQSNSETETTISNNDNINTNNDNTNTDNVNTDNVNTDNTNTNSINTDNTNTNNANTDNKKRKNTSITSDNENCNNKIKPPLNKKRKIDFDLSGIPPLEPMHGREQKMDISNAELANPHIIDGKNIYQINKNELKQLCRKMGLKVTGTKSELITSLSVSKTFLNRNNAIDKVHNTLKKVGVDDVDKVNKCLKRGIEKGYVKINLSGKGLDEVICSGKCDLCDKMFDASIRDVLYQKCYGGDDYEMGSEGGAVQHECEGLGGKVGMYVTEICEGKARFNDGKFHNHCEMCPGFGMCIGDYRMGHCRKCNKHFFGENCVCGGGWN